MTGTVPDWIGGYRSAPGETQEGFSWESKKVGCTLTIHKLFMCNTIRSLHLCHLLDFGGQLQNSLSMCNVHFTYAENFVWV